MVLIAAFAEAAIAQLTIVRQEVASGLESGERATRELRQKGALRKGRFKQARRGLPRSLRSRCAGGSPAAGSRAGPWHSVRRKIDRVRETLVARREPALLTADQHRAHFAVVARLLHDGRIGFAHFRIGDLEFFIGTDRVLDAVAGLLAVDRMCGSRGEEGRHRRCAGVGFMLFSVPIRLFEAWVRPRFRFWRTWRWSGRALTARRANSPDRTPSEVRPACPGA